MASSFSLGDHIQGRSALGSRLETFAAAYVLVVGGTSVASYLPGALGGESTAVVRVVLGLLGTMAGLVLWTQPSRQILGWRLAMLWAVVQIPVLAWNEYGNATLQLLQVPLAFSERTTLNGQETSYSQVGVNFLGFILAGIYGRCQREALWRQR